MAEESIARVGYNSTEYHPAFEEYSETIFELAEDGLPVIQARIAERLGVSRPAVSEMVRRMLQEELVEVVDGEVHLTAAGRDLATTIVRRHRLAERFLTDMLGLSWADAHHEAGRWEHVISPLVEDALQRVLHRPTTCPHGNPIPGSSYVEPADAMPLASVDPGREFVVVRIPEELEFEDGQLAFLERSGLMPGRSGIVMAIAPDGTATVEVDEIPIGVGGATARRIMVTSR